MAEEYGETQSWPVRPPDSVDTETRCGDSGHSVGGLPCRLTIVGGVREAWSVWRRGRLGTVCARGAHPAWSSGPSTSPLEPQCAVTGQPFILPPWLLWRLASAAAVRVSFFGSPMCQVSNAGGNWF